MKLPPRYPLTRDEIATLVGPVEDSIIAAIFDLEPNRTEFEEAIAWASGADDVMGEMERPQDAKVARLVEILTIDQEYQEEG